MRRVGRALVGPYGHRTALAFDREGYLASLSNPLGHAHGFTYVNDGLLSTYTNPRAGIRRYFYDPVGRLTRAEDPAGGSQALVRDELDARTYEVTRSTALGRTTTYRVFGLPIGDERRITTAPTGLASQRDFEEKGRRITTAPDGTVTSATLGPDPRFGMEAPITKEWKITTPSGLVSRVTTERTVTLANPNDPFTLQGQIDRLNLNGRVFVTTYDAPLRRRITTSPFGRQQISDFDVLGRLIRSETPGLVPVELFYDARGRLERIIQGPRVTLNAYVRLVRSQPL